MDALEGEWATLCVHWRPVGRENFPTSCAIPNVKVFAKNRLWSSFFALFNVVVNPELFWLSLPGIVVNGFNATISNPLKADISVESIRMCT